MPAGDGGWGTLRLNGYASSLGARHSSGASFQLIRTASLWLAHDFRASGTLAVPKSCATGVARPQRPSSQLRCHHFRRGAHVLRQRNRCARSSWLDETDSGDAVSDCAASFSTGHSDDRHAGDIVAAVDAVALAAYALDFLAPRFVVGALCQRSARKRFSISPTGVRRRPRRSGPSR